MIEIGRRDQRLPPALEHRDEAAAPIGVELAHHVVEQQQRQLPAGRAQRLALGEQQRQQAEPLLALRAVAAQRATAEGELDLVAVRPEAGEPAGDVPLASLRELGDDAVGVRARAIRGR